MVACELVVEGRQLLRPEVDHLDLEVHRAPGERRVLIALRIRNIERQVSAAVLPDQLSLDREREAAAAGLEEYSLAAGRLAAFHLAAQVEGHDVSRLDHLSIRDRTQLGDGLAHRLEHALDLVVLHLRRRTDDVEVAEIPEDDRGANVDGRRVAQSLTGLEGVGVDLRRPDDGEVMLVHGVMERVLDQPAQHLATDVVAKVSLEHPSWRLPRSKPGEPRLASDLCERAVDLGLDDRRGDLDLQPPAARSDLLDGHSGGVAARLRMRFLGGVHWRVSRRGPDLARSARGGTRTPTVAREILSLVRLPVPPLSRRIVSSRHP